MQGSKLLEILEKLPLNLLLISYLGFLGYQFYEFAGSDTSELSVTQKSLASAQDINKKLQQKIIEAEQFFKNLEQKTSDIRRLTVELDSTKSSLSESVDVAGFIKSTITEAKKTGLVVTSLKPLKDERKEYYSEQIFEMGFKGIYSQIALFVDRMSQSQRIIRIDNLKMSPVGVNTGRFVELSGILELKTFRYVGSKADEIGADKNPARPQLPAGSKPTGGT